MAFEKALRLIIAEVLKEVLPALIQNAFNKEPSEVKTETTKKRSKKTQIDTPDVSEAVEPAQQDAVDFAQLRTELVAAAKDVLAAGFRQEIYDLLQRYGCTKFPDLRDDQLVDFRQELDQIK